MLTMKTVAMMDRAGFLIVHCSVYAVVVDNKTAPLVDGLEKNFNKRWAQ